MPKYNNKKKITLDEVVISRGQIQEGMVISFRYRGGFDANPLVLITYHDKKKKMIEGINLNYITLRKIKELFKNIIGISEGRDIKFNENIPGESEDITRIQISAQRKRDNTTPEKFYAQIIKGDTQAKSAYRMYKLDKVSAVKAIDIDSKKL